MIAEKIRLIRTLKGLSQEYVASKLNLKQPEYSKIENGKSKITYDSIEKLAEIFEIDFLDLITFDENIFFKKNSSEESKIFFYVKKIINNSFEIERKTYLKEIKSYKEEIIFLRKKLGELNK